MTNLPQSTVSETTQIRACEDDDRADVIGLWEAAGLTRPWNDPHADFARKRLVQPELFLVAVDGGAIAGTVMAGYDGHRGWLYYLATDPARRGAGIGSALVREAEHRLVEMGCPKVQLMVRPDNSGVISFYEGLGYGEGEVLLLGKRTIEDAPPA